MEKSQEELKKEFQRLLKKSREHARKHTLTEKDMWDAIAKARARAK